MLALTFFVTAVLYASVGFGGGSLYLAILSFFELPYQHIPVIALLCNLIVSGTGFLHYFWRGHFVSGLFLPFILGSVPLAYLGGRVSVSRDMFMLLLGVSLIAAGLRLLVLPREQTGKAKLQHWVWKGFAGGCLGFLSGLVGIGGGIFLSPLMLNLGWGRPKQIAATTSAFIFVNSLSGLLGQISKTGTNLELSYWPLFLVVLVGGKIGASCGSGQRLSQVVIKRATAILTLVAGGNLLLSCF